MIKFVSIVFREKDLFENDYKKLVVEVLEVCRKNNIECILYIYYKVVKEFNCRKIYLLLYVLKFDLIIYKEFDEVGVFIYLVNEVIEVMNLGVIYIIVGYIFVIDCKKGVLLRGLDFLLLVCSLVNIFVYVIGGILFVNVLKVIDVGVEGVCIMLGFMICKIFELFFKI